MVQVKNQEVIAETELKYDWYLKQKFTQPKLRLIKVRYEMTEWW